MRLCRRINLQLRKREGFSHAGMKMSLSCSLMVVVMVAAVLAAQDRVAAKPAETSASSSQGTLSQEQIRDLIRLLRRQRFGK